MVFCKLPSLLSITPGAMSVAQGRWSARRCGCLRYSPRFHMNVSPNGGQGSGIQMRRLADMTTEDVKPVRIAFAHQHRRHVQTHARWKSKPPQMQTHSDHQSDRAVENGECPRRAAHEDRLG